MAGAVKQVPVPASSDQDMTHRLSEAYKGEMVMRMANGSIVVIFEGLISAKIR